MSPESSLWKCTDCGAITISSEESLIMRRKHYLMLAEASTLGTIISQLIGM